MVFGEQIAGVAAGVANEKEFQTEAGFYLSFGRLFVINLDKHIKKGKNSSRN